MSTQPPVFYVWTDFETTSRDLNTLKVLEVAIVVTDVSLRPYGSFVQQVLEPNDFVDLIKTECDPVVVKTHEDSGLWGEVEEFGSPLRDVERLVIGTIHSSLASAGIAARDTSSYQLRMVGSDIAGFDQFIARTLMPSFAEMMTQPPLDISSVRETAEIYFPDLMPNIVGLGESVPSRALAAIKHQMKTYALFIKYVRDLESEFDL